MKQLPVKYQDLLTDGKKAYAYLATVMPDGSPQVTPVWFSSENEYILINTAEGRVKDRNMRANPQVAMVIQDPLNPYRYAEIRGQVVDITHQGAVDHIHKLSHKYTGQDYTLNPAETREICKIKPQSIHAQG